MVNTVKFSNFTNVNLNDSTTQTVGLASGLNIRTPKVITWTTATRPIPPFDALLGFNTDLVQYEFWSSSLSSWVQLASTVNLLGTFILETPDLSLPNSFALSSLSTGILKSTTGTGILSISAPLTSIDSLITVADEIIYTTASNVYATTILSTFSRGLLSDTTALQWRSALGVAGIPVNVSQGGTGDVSFTPYSVICGGTTPTNPLQNVSGIGVLGQVLTSNGVGMLPTWQNSSSSGSVNPGLINQLAYYAANGSTISGLATTPRGVLATNASGVPSINTNLLPFIVGPGGFYTTIQSAINDAALIATTTNHGVVLINAGTYTENITLASFVDMASFGGDNSNTAVIEGNSIYNPINDNETFSASGITFQTPGGGGSAFAINGAKICIVDLNECTFNGTTGTAFECTNANASISKSSCHANASSGQKILNLTDGSITVLNGKVFATDTASTLSGNSNLVLSGCFDVNSFILTGTSQLSAVNSVILPPGTLPFIDIGPGSAGIIFSDSIVSNAASGFWATGTGFIAANAVTSNAGSAPNIDPALTKIQEPLIIGKLSFNGGLNNFETTGNFNVIQTYTGNTNVTFPTSGTLATTSQLPVLPLSLTDGGTNASLVASAGSIVYSTASAFDFTSVGLAGQLLQSNAAGTPLWTTATYPSVATNTGSILRANGTNWVASTSDFADTYTASNILYSNGSNNVVGLATSINAVLITDGGGVPSISSTLPSAVQGNITSLGTITSGTWNGTAIDVAHGGTGDSSFTAFSVICAGTTATGNFQNVVGVGAIGQVLTSQGPGTLPTWVNAPGTGTINSGGINQLAYYAAAGTTISGLATANDGVVVTGNTGIPSVLVGPGTTGNILQSNTASAPSWSTPTYPTASGSGGKIIRSDGTNNVYSTFTINNTYSVNNLLFAGAANALSGLSTANNGMLVTSATGVPSILAGPGTTGNILQSNAAAAPSFSTATYPGIATTTGTILRADGTNWVKSTSTFADTYSINTILYNASANTVSGLTTAASSILVTDAGGVPSLSTTLPAFTTSSITFSPTTGGIVGTTTNNNAAAGKVGEFVTSQVLFGASVNPSGTGAAKDITSISLTAGDWDVFGNVTLAPTGLWTTGQGWISSTSATAPDTSMTYQIAVASNGSNSGCVPYVRFSLAGTTTIYLSAKATFSTGTINMSGGIFARRVR